ncbi:MAG TPA: Clp protease N-terminal domain-containing protein, partial [Gemmataceae bacterium]|nr:Clp protease N-terminal domain-containing protein [Gemmataceae bacterium]
NPPSEAAAMLDRFTDRARNVMKLANEDAKRFSHESIGTEHILLGLVKETSGVAANVLKNLDIDLRKVRLEVEKIVQTGPGSEMVTMGRLPKSPWSKKVINYSIEEARNLGHNYVGTEHLLLGLLREQECVAAQILMNLGLTLADARAEVTNLLGHSFVSPPPVDKPIIRQSPPPLPPEVRRIVDELTAEIERLTSGKEVAFAAQEWDRAAVLHDLAVHLQRAKNAIVREWIVKKPDEPPVN